jgi:hypothetical protein
LYAAVDIIQIERRFSSDRERRRHMARATSASIEYLQTPEGAGQLRSAAGIDVEGPALLRELTRLRRSLSADQAAAVIEQTALRRRAAAKFTHAAEMLFTVEGLEQASGESVAAHSAARYRGLSQVADCCCGIGGDLLALAKHARVAAYDRDPVSLACAKHNAAVHGLLSRVTCHLADVETLDLAPGSASSLGKESGVEAIFFDPGRRSDGRRIYSLQQYVPPVSTLERWLPSVPAIGVKVAPGVAHDEVTWECEQEFVAEGPDLKEGLLWFGPLARAARTATVLPAGVSLTDGEAPEPEVSEPLGWLYDPSPAVTRAGLIWELALMLGARQLDARLAYMTGPECVDTPLARAYAVESWMPFNLKRLQARLRLLGAGKVEVHRRGAPIKPAELERQLRQEGADRRLVFLTRLRGRMIAITCLDERRSGPPRKR